MPRGRLPTGIVASTFWLAPSMIVTSSERSLLTQTRKSAGAARVVSVAKPIRRVAKSFMQSGHQALLSGTVPISESANSRSRSIAAVAAKALAFSSKAFCRARNTAHTLYRVFSWRMKVRRMKKILIAISSAALLTAYAQSSGSGQSGAGNSGGSSGTSSSSSGLSSGSSQEQGGQGGSSGAGLSGSSSGSSSNSVNSGQSDTNSVGQGGASSSGGMNSGSGSSGGSSSGTSGSGTSGGSNSGGSSSGGSNSGGTGGSSTSGGGTGAGTP
jgi:hypothetical protein